MKKIVILLLLISFALSIIMSTTGCKKNTQSTFTNAASVGTPTDSVITEATSEAAEQTSVRGIRTDSENDTERGLRNIKTQDKSDFSDMEKLMIQYFDTDYFRLPDYENLQRYPKVYKGAQICFVCTVYDILWEEGDEFTILANDYAYTRDHFVVLKGSLNGARLIPGDEIYVYGKYTGIETYENKDKSYKVPTVTINRYSYCGPEWIYPLFSYNDIKKLAEYIFGDVIISDWLDSEYYNYVEAPILPGHGDAYVVELENQSNANFTAYRFSAANGTALGGNISDLKSTDAEERTISFSADFNHFYVKNFNHTLSNFTLSCYDRDLNRIWKREFEDTASASFDCTTSNIYLIANGYMYIINASTGEDVFEKKYVGQKTGIRKVKDGIILIAETAKEAIMKTDLKGNILWTVDTDYDGRENEVIQIIGDNIVFSYDFTHYDENDRNYVLSGERAMVVSSEGKILEVAKPPVESYKSTEPATATIIRETTTNDVNTFSGYCWTTDYLNVRSGPGTDYRVLEVLPPNSKVYVYGIETDRNGNIWAKLSDGVYASGDYLVY